MRIRSGRAADIAVKSLATRATKLTTLEPQVRRIINDVRRNGDRALRRYAERWDGLAKNQSLQVPEAEIAAAYKNISPDLRQSLREAAINIRRFCQWQMPKSWTRTRSGVSLGQLVRPADRFQPDDHPTGTRVEQRTGFVGLSDPRVDPEHQPQIGDRAN